MKKIAFILLIVTMMLVVACQGTALEPTVAPEQTVATEATPTAEEEPTEEASATGSTLDGSLDEELAQMTAIAPPPQLSDREPGVHTVPCLPEVSFGVQLVEGEDYTCGVFTVPQNWDDPDGRNLDLGFVVVNAIDDNPEPDPLLYLEGGPGGSAILSTDISRYRNLRSDRDIILYDIRGAGLSQRIGFAECLVLAKQNGAPEDQIEALWAANATLWAATHSEMPEIEDLKIWEVDFPLLNKICWEQFTGQGFDLNQFSTASNARDAVELIKALGYDSFNIHGASYGTRQAMTIMDVLPEIEEAPQLRSVVLDSTFPPSVYLIRTIGRSHHDFVVQLLEECQADAACSAAYPNLKERLATLLDRLEEEPLTANGETVTIDDVVDELTNLGGSRAAYIPKLIAELETGVLDTYLALRNGEVGTDAVEALPLLDLDVSDPVQAFIADSLDLLSSDAALEFAFYVNIAFSQEDPMVILQAVIEESYSGEIGDQMLELLGTLTTEDFASSPYVSQQLAAAASETDPELILARSRRSVAGGIPRPLYSSVHCIDDIQHERFEDAVNSYNDLQFPQLTNLVESLAQAGRCENWPVAAAPIEVKDPVSSDVPVIILQGAYDGPTPVYMGRRTARELENSTYVLVPQQGHGTWTRSDDCVGQIAGAFIQNPDTALDLSCLDARRPQWALPGNGEP